MPFSFNPGQEQAVATPVQSNNNGVPVLNVPVAPVISLTPAPEVISAFAYRNRSKSKFGVYFQSVIFLIFGLNFVAALGIFGYQTVLKAQINGKKEALATLQEGFVKPPTEEMQQLSSRVTLINKILNERASALAALTVLEESANDPVTYTKFSLAKSKKDKFYDLTFSGETNSYASLYQQIELLKSKTFSGTFPKLSFGGIGPLDKKGITAFKVDASVSINGIDPEDGFTVIHKNNQATTTASNTRVEEVAPATTTPQAEGVQQASSSLVNVTP